MDWEGTINRQSEGFPGDEPEGCLPYSPPPSFPNGPLFSLSLSLSPHVSHLLLFPPFLFFPIFTHLPISPTSIFVSHPVLIHFLPLSPSHFHPHRTSWRECTVQWHRNKTHSNCLGKRNGRLGGRSERKWSEKS